MTPGNRVLLASGEAQLLPGVLDTAFDDVAAGRVAQGVSFTLANTGVPFLFIDRGVRNSLRYFYSVTAFDVNSLVSGPSSLESARVTKAVTPAPAVDQRDHRRGHRRDQASFGRDGSVAGRIAPDTRSGHGQVQRPVPAGRRRRSVRLAR